MIWRNTTERYGMVAAGLHWLIALTILGLLALGLYMTSLKPSPAMFKLYFWHKSFGITVLSLATLRLVWRLTSIHPLALPTHATWEKFLARLAHVMLYVCMFVMPLSGWIMSSAKGFTVSVFGWFNLPNFVGENPALSRLMVTVHEWIAWILIGLIALHAAGALKHHLIDRDATLRRMLPGTRIVPPALALMTAALLLLPAGAAAQDKSSDKSLPLWTVDAAHSSLTFEGSQMGAPFTGNFPRFDAMISFDPDNLEHNRVTVTIPMAGAKTGSSERDDYIHVKEWLDAESFPESTYTATKFEKVKDNQYIAHGLLTLRGVALPVDLPFTLDIAPDGAGHSVARMKGETALQRLDYGIGGGEWKDTHTVGNRVIVRVSLTATRPE